MLQRKYQYKTYKRKNRKESKHVTAKIMNETRKKITRGKRGYEATGQTENN